MRIHLLFLFASISPLCAEPRFILEEKQPQILAPKLTEASGLAISPTNPNFLWAINDSGNTPELHLIKTTGESCGTVTVKGLKNKDWEDLASYKSAGSTFLVIADTGDNRAKRNRVSFHIIREPTLPKEGKTLDITAPCAWSVEIYFEDGPRDCEAVAVDPARKKLILLTKRTKIPELYEVDLKPQTNGPQMLTKIGTLTTKAPRFSLIPFGNQPTAMDISQDGSMAAITTYSGIFIFEKLQNENWIKAFRRKPQWIGPHGLAQAETIAISQDRSKIYLTSEGKNPPLIHFKDQK